MNEQRLGGILINRGIISQELLEKAQKISDESPDLDLSRVLIEHFNIDHDLIHREIAEFYGFREINLSEERVDEKALEFIRERLESMPKKIRDECIRKQIIPFKIDPSRHNSVIFITPEPTRLELSDLIKEIGERFFEITYCPLSDFMQILDQTATPTNEFLEIFKEANEETELDLQDEDDEDFDDELLEAEINQSMLTNLVEGCLVEAVRQGISDIHIIPEDKTKTGFYFRKDGRLFLWHRHENCRPESIAAIIKDRTKNADRFEWDIAQDGFIQRMVDNHLIRYRVSILPIVSAEFRRRFESVVIRVLDDRKVITDLDKLGLSSQAKSDFMKAITKPQGIVILTGPTGSGKSTTLVAALHQVMTPELNILTVEDPVEYLIRGARQLKINPRMDFDAAMRSILRHDPDIVMVGEMRDRPTAEIAIKLANTGHLTFSTLHTNDAPSAVSRLYKMGIEPFLIANAINIVVAQRLVRTLCHQCKQVYEPEPNIPLSLGFTKEEVEKTDFYTAVGCESCRNGYRGRTGIHEALVFTKEIRQIILDAKGDINEEKIRQTGIEQGMTNLRAAGRERIKEGVSTLQEIAFATAED